MSFRGCRKVPSGVLSWLLQHQQWGTVVQFSSRGGLVSAKAAEVLLTLRRWSVCRKAWVMAVVLFGTNSYGRRV